MSTVTTTTTASIETMADSQSGLRQTHAGRGASTTNTAPTTKPADSALAVDTTTTNGQPKDSVGRRPRKYRHVEAVHHKVTPSTLSHDAPVAPSFLGFRNLMVIVLVAGNVRLMIENLQKYGVLICLGCHDFRRQDVILGLILYFLIPAHLFAAYLIELAAATQAKGLLAGRSKRNTLLRRKWGVGSSNGGNKKRANDESSDDGNGEADGTRTPTDEERRRFAATWRVVAVAHGLNVTLALAIATYVVYFHVHHPLIGTLTELHAIIVWLKTASYALTNRDLRHAYLHPHRLDEPVPDLYGSMPYPRNITMSNLVYFWWAPTLVYQPVYPRTPKVRWLFVAKRLGEVCCLSAFIWFASAQYAAPVLRNSLDKLATFDLPAIAERLLKLSTISLVIWLAGFFALFQSFLNALAEVTRFGDRSFYDDWWNSDSLGSYWRTWNKPVYKFFRRHLYSPMVGRGYSTMTASITVFFVSALLHELLVGIPTHNLIGGRCPFCSIPFAERTVTDRCFLPLVQESPSSACSSSCLSSTSRGRSSGCTPQPGG